MIAANRAREAILSSTAVKSRPLTAESPRSSRCTREQILFDQCGPHSAARELEDEPLPTSLRVVATPL